MATPPAPVRGMIPERTAAVNDLAIVRNHLSYASSLERRLISDIDIVVIHCTELPDLLTARSYGEHIQYPESGTGNSGHFYIERNGRIEEWVPSERIAHHVRGFNERSIGIELVNRGRYPDWLDSRNQSMCEPYAAEQIDSLIRLLSHLSERLPGLRFVTGHETLDTTLVPATDNPGELVRRKQDPGPMFEWEELLGQTELTYFAPT